jgi:hypothetical protein
VAAATQRCHDREFSRRGVEGRKSRRSCARACAGDTATQAEIQTARVMALKKKRNAEGSALLKIGSHDNNNVQTNLYTQSARLL